MIAFVKFARRFRRTPPQFFLPLQIPYPSSSNPTHYFSQAFHRTLTAQSQPTTQNPHIFHEPININRYIDNKSVYNQSGVAQLLDLLKNANDFPSEVQAVAFLDECDVKPSEGLVNLVIWGLKEEWKVAYWVFKWGEKWGCNSEKNWRLMIWVLGKHRKFNTAWCLIRDLHRAEMDTKPAMLIMMERYAAANDPGKAIQTFQTMEKFSMTPDLEAYYTLLNALCKNGNIEEAEEFMFLNKKLFPLESERFNIILNGWCNISVDVFEAKRVWREMSKSCILPNARRGLLMKAREFFAEMKFNGISDDPKLKKLLKEPLRESVHKSSGIKGKSHKQSRKNTKGTSLDSH